MASEVPPLKVLFSKFPIKIDKKLAEDILRWRKLYETRDNNPEVLNTPLLGCENLGFFTKDQNALFDLVGIDRDEFKRAIRQSSVDKKFIVASDEFNLLVVWIAHCFMITTAISRDLKDKVIVAVFFMLMMKFFTGVVRHLFPYLANRTTMEATIDNLSDKFDIKHPETSTWKLVIEKRAELLTDTSKDNIHYNTLLTFTPDSKVTYVLTDLQTRIRTKIKLIATAYYEAVEEGNSIATTTLTSIGKEGDKTIKELQNSYDAMIESICNRVLNVQQFVNNSLINVVCGLCSNLRPELVRSMLMQFSAMATLQYQKGKGDSMDKTGKLYQGYHILISNAIQRTYRACIMDRTPLKRLYILKKAMNIYRSSRISDPIIICVRDSVGKFVEETKLTTREATKASLKVGLILYFIMMSFNID